ncbi:tsl1847 [Thermosynechococcus vestitus BP-1]|uniref:Tsl1847 protein n=1 Tax=Thermosynechococcus vestitus (strain NIES-2133 / IAM M-273 / BP-1) TaxID=197221 RepID=Q8DHU8_THEVB|nr:tsl1847 [Thermosynechococcus vestitus BP-1]
MVLPTPLRSPAITNAIVNPFPKKNQSMPAIHSNTAILPLFPDQLPSGALPTPVR